MIKSMHTLNKQIAGTAVLFFFIIAGIMFSAPSSAEAQVDIKEKIKNPKIEIFGELTDTKDYFGRKRFSGKVVNKEKARIDYIHIEFTMRNKVGKELETVKQFIKGKFHQFADFQVSTSSLDGGQTGTFDIISSIPADSVYTFTYKITGTHFIFK